MRFNVVQTKQQSRLPWRNGLRNIAYSVDIRFDIHD